MKYYSALDLAKNELQNAKIQNLGSAPSSPATAQIYFDTTLGMLGIYNGSGWDYYLTPSSISTLTNKTLSGSANTITNLTLAMLAANVADTDTTLAANSDLRVATQKAVKTYIDGLVTSGMKMRGTIDCSANPNYPSAAAGDFYKVSVAGKIGGASGVDVAAGDSIVAVNANAGGTQASVGSDWDVIQANVDQATTAVLGLVALATSSDAEAKSNTAKAVTPAALANFPVKKTFTIGNGSSTTLTVTHNLNTKDVIVQVRDASTDAVVYCDIASNNVNSVDLIFSTAPSSNAFKVTVIG
jgi:hypothetical protein